MAGESILVVDDNPQNLRLMTALLRIEGYEVRTAADAEETLSTLQTFTPQAILMDIQLPGMDGLELTRRLRQEERFKHTPVFALTAYATEGDAAKALGAGFDEYVTKPIDVHELPKLLAERLARAGELR